MEPDIRKTMKSTIKCPLTYTAWLTGMRRVGGQAAGRAMVGWSPGRPGGPGRTGQGRRARADGPGRTGQVGQARMDGPGRTGRADAHEQRAVTTTFPFQLGGCEVPNYAFRKRLDFKISVGFVNRAALREVILRGKSVPFMLPQKRTKKE